MTSKFLCPNCSLSVEAGSDFFGAECACPECAQVFVVPYPSAIPALSEEWERMLAEKEALQVALDEARKLQGLAELETQRLLTERELATANTEEESSRSRRQVRDLEVQVEELRQKARQVAEEGAQELAFGQKRIRELENELQSLRAGVEQAAENGRKYELLLEEHNGLQRRMEVLERGVKSPESVVGTVPSSEEYTNLAGEKASLQVAFEEARKAQGLAEAEVKRLMFEAEGIGGKWEAERAAAQKRCEELERDLDGVRKEFKQVEGFAKQNQALVQERNRLQDRIQELNVQQKAQQPVPESWGYTGGQNQRIESGGGGSLVGTLALLLVGGVLGIACGLGGAPFVSQKYPKLAALVRFWNRDLPVVVSSENPDELPSEGLSLSKSLDGKENPAPPAAPVEPQIAQLPDAFQGIVLGGSLSGAAVGTEKGQWKETNGRLHRKVELLGQGVEAVLVPDAQGRLVMGAYVRICSKQIPELTPFLEWAVSVQDSLSAQWGPPSDIHQISGVAEPAEVVEKVSRGEDFYQAIWEREGQDTQVVLSIRSWNERSVAFRLEYKSLSLTRQYVQKEPPSGVEPSK